jgi:hypothetical protein
MNTILSPPPAEVTIGTHPWRHFVRCYIEMNIVMLLGMIVAKRMFTYSVGALTEPITWQGASVVYSGTGALGDVDRHDTADDRVDEASQVHLAAHICDGGGDASCGCPTHLPGAVRAHRRRAVRPALRGFIRRDARTDALPAS